MGMGVRVLFHRLNHGVVVFYVYAHYDESGECRYVGKGHARRAWSIHGRNGLWRSIFPDGPKKIELIASGLSEFEAFKSEIESIKLFRKLGCHLANRNDGGPGGGRAWLGKKRDPKFMRQIAAMSHTPQAIAKASAAKRGRRHTEAHKLAIQAALPKKRIVCTTTGDEFKSINEAARAFGLGSGRVSEVANGIRKSAKGFCFSFG